jgi:hypothetical protein
MRPVLHASCPRSILRRSVATSCEVVRERDFRLVGKQVMDLSAKGMLVESEIPLLTGEELIVTFQGPTSSRWYDCTATVARVVHGRRRRDRSRAVGIAFETLDVLSELLLCEELRDVPVARRHLASHACAR